MYHTHTHTLWWLLQEPHENGPLYTEIAFYCRAAKEDMSEYTHTHTQTHPHTHTHTLYSSSPLLLCCSQLPVGCPHTSWPTSPYPDMWLTDYTATPVWSTGSWSWTVLGRMWRRSSTSVAAGLVARLSVTSHSAL